MCDRFVIDERFECDLENRTNGESDRAAEARDGYRFEVVAILFDRFPGQTRRDRYRSNKQRKVL